MADKFDPYREALVMETTTIWPSNFADLPVPEKRRLEEKLHADPAACGQGLLPPIRLMAWDNESTA